MKNRVAIPTFATLSLFVFSGAFPAAAQTHVEAFAGSGGAPLIVGRVAPSASMASPLTSIGLGAALAAPGAVMPSPAAAGGFGARAFDYTAVGAPTPYAYEDEARSVALPVQKGFVRRVFDALRGRPVDFVSFDGAAVRGPLAAEPAGRKDDIKALVAAAPVVKTPDRFELRIGDLVAFAVYREVSGSIIFPHTVTPEELEGNGAASKIARAALDYAREHGLKVVPACAFFQGYMRKHPEYQDLLDPRYKYLVKP